ncbi:hypothetical protein Q0F99_12590 [Rathayibacter oskolensis]|uniref:hypothetical protein n=1 Tax=Rathayibacter oskolensis TaxID=1891671 RepID=UPI00265D68AD|nr:hypothetical protein [Rathayibacter oskolensis]WKK70657.1 hypothetical protein Q0F99_12590 [Rathayibacter oskolensis]
MIAFSEGIGGASSASTSAGTGVLSRPFTRHNSGWMPRIDEFFAIRVVQPSL